MGIISYVLRCSETEYSSYNQFWSSTASTTAILRSSGTTFEANKCKVDLKVKMGIISYVLRCSETEYSSYNQFWSSTASTTAILRSSGMTFEANKCKVQLKGQYGYHFLWSKVFWNRIFKLQSVSVFHGLYYSHFEVIWDDLRSPKMLSSTKWYIWVSFSML